MKIDHQVTATEAGKTVAALLREEIGLSGRLARRLARAGKIRLNGRRAHLERLLKPGERIIVELPGRGAARPRASTSPPVIFENADYVVVNKPSGVESAGTNQAPHLVHRLDKHASGALLLARHAIAQDRLQRRWNEGVVTRTYVALTTGCLEQQAGVVDAPIRRDPNDRMRRQVHSLGQPARTHYSRLLEHADTSLARVELDTGRTHQIRVHCRHLGHPLLGDRLYGGRLDRIGRLALHAIKLSFLDPFGEERVDVTAPLPDDLSALIRHVWPDTSSAAWESG